MENVFPYIQNQNNVIIIYGGWCGVLASLIFQSNINIDKIDAILYINLEHRTDRKEHILNEIKKIDPILQKIDQEFIFFDQRYLKKLREKQMMLAASDWRVLPDAPEANKAAWVAYRQQLRDITNDLDVSQINGWDDEVSLNFFPQKPE